MTPQRSSTFKNHRTMWFFAGVIFIIGLLNGGLATRIDRQPFPKWACGAHHGQALHTLVKDGKFPFINDGVNFYNVVHEFVKEWVHAFFSSEEVLRADKRLSGFYAGLAKQTSQFAYKLPKELNRKNFVNAVSQFIFVVTGFHEVVGGVSEHLNHWKGVSMRITPESDHADIQSQLIALALMAGTSVKTPDLVGNYNNYFVKKDERRVWEEFQTKLKDLSAKLKLKNKGRVKNGRFAYRSFDPKLLQVAVAV